MSLEYHNKQLETLESTMLTDQKRLDWWKKFSTAFEIETNRGVQSSHDTAIMLPFWQTFPYF